MDKKQADKGERKTPRQKEIGLNGGIPSCIEYEYSKLTQEKREELKRRIYSGEKIYPF